MRRDLRSGLVVELLHELRLAEEVRRAGDHRRRDGGLGHLVPVRHLAVGDPVVPDHEERAGEPVVGQRRNAPRYSKSSGRTRSAVITAAGGVVGAGKGVPPASQDGSPTQPGSTATSIATASKIGPSPMRARFIGSTPSPLRGLCPKIPSLRHERPQTLLEFAQIPQFALPQCQD